MVRTPSVSNQDRIQVLKPFTSKEVLAGHSEPAVPSSSSDYFRNTSPSLETRTGTKAHNTEKADLFSFLMLSSLHSEVI